MDDKLYLKSSRTKFNDVNPDLESYTIGTENMDDDEFDDWKTVLFEILGQLIREYTAIVDYTYIPKKKYKKRILFSDRIPKYSHDGFCDRLMKDIVDKDLNWHFIEKEYGKKAKWEQKLYVINHHPDYQFIEMAYVDWKYIDSIYGLGIRGFAYTKGRLKQMKSIEEILKNYEQGESWAIYFGIDGIGAGMCISIDPYQVSIKQLTRQIQKVCEKHNIKLEVKI